MWEWSVDCQWAFNHVWLHITSEPILHLLDFILPFEVHTDTSDYTIGGVLLQASHPMVFKGQKLNDTER